nr:hypothetical protein [Mycobacterium marinum]
MNELISSIQSSCHVGVVVAAALEACCPSRAAALDLPARLALDLDTVVPELFAAAAACLASPLGSLVCGGSENGAKTEAAAELPAYSYIAPASCAHISA